MAQAWRAAALLQLAACVAACGPQVAARESASEAHLPTRVAEPPASPRPSGPFTVYVAMSVKCPCARATLPRLRELEQTYAARGVTFVYLYPSIIEDEDAKRAYHAASGLAGAAEFGASHDLAVALGVTAAPQAVVLDACQTVRFRGPPDDSPIDPAHVTRRHLALALDALLGAVDVAVDRPRVQGCRMRL